MTFQFTGTAPEPEINSILYCACLYLCLKVGIRDDRLKLVLEPEAASVYCALRPTARQKGASDGKTFQPLPEGTKYIIVDIGGNCLIYVP